MQLYYIHHAAPTVILAAATSYVIQTYSHKSIITNAITNEFIYQFLLPLIVLTEGFNLRKRSLSFYKKEVTWLGLLLPFVGFALQATFLISLQMILYKYIDLDKERIQKNEVIISLAIVLSTVEVHGTVAPLMSVKNLRLYKILFSGGMFNNNISLVIVMTFERMIHANGKFRITRLWSKFNGFELHESRNI